MELDPCICGHTRLYHPTSSAIINKCMALYEVTKMSGVGFDSCRCLGFKLDNLKFMEQYEKE